MEREALPPSENGAEGHSPGPAWSQSEAPERDAHIEEYLDRIRTPLVGVVPDARCQELCAEIAAHLDALVAAYQELGSGPDEAVSQALVRFGDPEDVARAWAGEWLRGQEHSSTMHAARVAFGACTGVTVMVFLGGYAYTRWHPDVRALDYGLGIGIFFGAPVVAGLAAGTWRRGRVVAGTLLGIAASLVPFAVAHAMDQAARGSVHWGSVWLTPLRMSLVWLPIACLCAAAARWAQNMRTRRQVGLAGR
jgi:hypothetical protein